MKCCGNITISYCLENVKFYTIIYKFIEISIREKGFENTTFDR